MKTFKKLVSLLLSLTMLFCLSTVASMTVHAADDDRLISGTFTAQTLDGTDPGELSYYYSDDYFGRSGKEVDPHLMTMSAALVFTTRGVSATPEETYGEILREIGFCDILTVDMDHITMQTIGVVLAHKKIGGKDVVAVVIRGDDYGVEMAANFIADKAGDIKAFADAEALVESRVDDYLASYGITAAQYWVVGYSRSGAVANLFGRELNRNLAQFCTTADDIYVYTFEAPLSSGDDTAYENIHNVIDLRDVVTYVYPSLWLLYHSGVPAYIGSADETITLYRLDFTSENYLSELDEVNSADFLREFIDFIAKNISRAVYAEKLQTPISQVLEIFFNLDPDQREELLAYFKKVGEEMKDDDLLFVSLLGPILSPYSAASVKTVTNLLTGYMDKVSDEYGKPLDDDSYATVQEAIRPMVEVLLPVFSKDYKAKYDRGDGSGQVYATLYRFLTFFNNLEALFKHHYNYNIFNELMALDSYYEKKPLRIRGDSNGDGNVNILDATHIQRRLAGFTLNFFDHELSDADGNGKITIIDATAIQRYLAHLATNEGIGASV